MNQRSQPKKDLREKIRESISFLTYFTKEVGPWYWQLKPDPERNLPRAIVISFSGSDDDIEAAIKLVNNIRMRQMSKSKVHEQQRAEYHDSKLSDSEE